jgi:predicted alpha/beta-fold hydrolase
MIIAVVYASELFSQGYELQTLTLKVYRVSDQILLWKATASGSISTDATSKDLRKAVETTWRLSRNRTRSGVGDLRVTTAVRYRHPEGCETVRGMPHQEGRFSGAGSQGLHYQCWEPEARPRAIVAVVHGFGEHGGRYGNVVRHLVPHGYAVYAFDHRGHGRSPGQRGHINAWSEFRGDVREFLSLIRQEQSKRPMFLLGHSLGGLIAIEYVLRRRPS